MGNKLFVRKASENSDKQLIKELLPRYLKEISGSSHYPYFEEYWIDPKRFPYVFCDCSNRQIGFAFVRYIEERKRYEIAEFFIEPQFRKQGLGFKAFSQLVSYHAGDWMLGVLPKNVNGYEFWRKTIERVCGRPAMIRLIDDGKFLFLFSTERKPTLPENGHDLESG